MQPPVWPVSRHARAGTRDAAAGRRRAGRRVRAVRHCHRTPLVGERVYVFDLRRDALRAVPRRRPRDVPSHSRLMHGPEFGHTMRMIDQRRATERRLQPEGLQPRLHRPGARHHRIPAVEPFTVSATIASLAKQVFEYLADIANHAEFTDHYLVDWHLTREDSYGTGAGARFRIKAPRNRFRLGRLHARRDAAAVQDRRAGPGRQVQPHPDARHLHAVARAGR